MMDMDEDPDEQDGATAAPMTSLTGFLFGNIDKKGNLKEDFLDEVGFNY